MINDIHSLLMHWLWSGVGLSTLLPLMLLALFSGLVALENHFPRQFFSNRLRKQSQGCNLGLFVSNSVIVSFLIASSLLLLSEHFANAGLLSEISNPICKGILAFLCFDLLLYLWHIACHRFEYLWLFHRVHHSDVAVNVSTAFRVHCVEIILTTLLKATSLVVLGLDKTVMLVVDAVFTSFVMFHHSNIRFGWERSLGKVFIVPYLHRSHHSTERFEHDSNYGAVLSLWDRLFGTLKELEPVRMGIKVSSPQTTLGLIFFGFGCPGHVELYSKPMINDPGAIEAMIAEAAYYKAEKRAFCPGHELSDWLEAKSEILNVVLR